MQNPNSLPGEEASFPQDAFVQWNEDGIVLLRNVTKHDDGIYKCNAKNIAGESVSYVTLHVLDAANTTRMVPYERGDSPVQLRCFDGVRY